MCICLPEGSSGSFAAPPKKGRNTTHQKTARLTNDPFMAGKKQEKTTALKRFGLGMMDTVILESRNDIIRMLY